MRMRMIFAGRGEWERQNREWQNMGIGCAGRREWEWERQNREWWQNTEWQTTLAALISSRDYTLLELSLNYQNQTKKFMELSLRWPHTGPRPWPTRQGKQRDLILWVVFMQACITSKKEL
jgi:hypothetical protein